MAGLKTRRALRSTISAAAGMLMLCSATAFGQTAAQPSLSSLFDELVGLVRTGQWGALEWARGSYLALQINRYGKSGVPYMRGRFARAGLPEEAFLSGIYVVAYGEDVDHRSMRRALEADQRKRSWLRGMVGDWNAIRASMRSGAQWQPALRFLPALGGCRNFCRLCMQSDDVLVRRAGLQWGFWVADTAYWRSVQSVSTSDPDPLTRQFAQYLFSRRPAVKPK